MVRTVLVILLAALILTPFALAEDKAGGKKDTKKPAGTPFDKLIRDLRGLIAREKAKPEYAKDLVRDLERLVKSHEKSRPAVRLEDLSEEDREKLIAEVRQQLADERRGREDGGGNDWTKRRVERVMENVKIRDDKVAEVEELLTDYAKDVATAYGNGDYKLIGDLKKDLEKSLMKSVGRKTAKDIMNEINKQFGGRRGGWGR